MAKHPAADRPAAVVLVEQVGQQILLVFWQAVEQEEEVRLVAEHELGSNYGSGRSFPYDQGRIGRHVRQCLRYQSIGVF